MHYYKRNIGDYHKKAGRLSMLQHGAYTLLLDSCYDREEFPTLDQAIEWTWASTPEEEQAVIFVLNRFFTELADGRYEHSRVYDEVEKFQARSETNKKIARDRETKRRREATKGEQVVVEAQPNHEPITINQEPAPIVPKNGDGGSEVKRRRDEQREIAKQAISLINTISGREFKLIDSNLKPVMARLEDGHTSADIAMVLQHKWLEWRHTKNEQYYRPSTLFRPSKFEGYLNDARNPVPEGGRPGTGKRSTRDISLEESLNDTSWAD